MILALLLSLQTVTAGPPIPPNLLGSYSFSINKAPRCRDPNQPIVTISSNVFSFRGEKLPILLVEKISDLDWHIWVRARAEVKDRKVELFHLSWGNTANSGVVVESEEGAAEAILEYGQPVADAGVWGLYDRCLKD